MIAKIRKLANQEIQKQADRIKKWAKQSYEFSEYDNKEVKEDMLLHLNNAIKVVENNSISNYETENLLKMFERLTFLKEILTLNQAKQRKIDEKIIKNIYYQTQKKA